MAAARVLISVVSWNSADSIQACLTALRAQTAAADILVIDNGSTDGCLNLVRRDFPQVAVQALTHNSGFCGGHNIALRHAMEHGHDFIWLVNDDTHCAPDTLQRLLDDMAAHPDCGVLSPVIVNRVGQERSFEFCGAVLDPVQLRKRKARDQAHLQALRANPAVLPMLQGTAILVRRTLLDRIGLLNEGLFAYYDDDDLSTRCHRAGIQVRMCFDAEIWHDNPPSPQRSPHYHYLMTRNRWLFWSAFFGGRLPLAQARRLLARSLREAGSHVARGQAPNARAAVRGLLDAWAGRQGPPPPQLTPNAALYKLLLWHPHRLADVLHADAEV